MLVLERRNTAENKHCFARRFKIRGTIALAGRSDGCRTFRIGSHDTSRGGKVLALILIVTVIPTKGRNYRAIITIGLVRRPWENGDPRTRTERK